jgi:acetyl esterase/lipase
MKNWCILLIPAAALAAGPAAIPIWPNDPTPDQEQTRIGPGDNVRRIANVTRPTITPFLPEPGKATGAGVIILPGGGFRHLAIDKEGHDVAKWLNTMGVAGFVVRYRVMPAGKDSAEDREAAKAAGVKDTLEAIRLVRARAAQWKLDARRIGVMGFSAGGYHAASAAVQGGGENRPDFAVCVYPASPENLDFKADAPPVFLAHADDDRLAAGDHSVRIYLALKKAKIPAELHIFSKGGHGFGMEKRGMPTDTWTARLQEWMSGLGLLARP